MEKSWPTLIFKTIINKQYCESTRRPKNEQVFSIDWTDLAVIHLASPQILQGRMLSSLTSMQADRGPGIKNGQSFNLVPGAFPLERTRLSICTPYYKIFVFRNRFFSRTPRCRDYIFVTTCYITVFSRWAPDWKMAPSSRSLVMDNYWKTLKILRNLYCPNKTLALLCDI